MRRLIGAQKNSKDHIYSHLQYYDEIRISTEADNLPMGVEGDCRLQIFKTTLDGERKEKHALDVSVVSRLTISSTGGYGRSLTVPVVNQHAPPPLNWDWASLETFAAKDENMKECGGRGGGGEEKG